MIMIEVRMLYNARLRRVIIVKLCCEISVQFSTCRMNSQRFVISSLQLKVLTTACCFATRFTYLFTHR